MILLQLFWTFFKIGAVSFGGGYAMIPLIRESCLTYDWLTEKTLVDLIAVSESTPGPIAVNCATFVGSTQAGAAGAIAATLGVILPSFFVILLIAALLRNLLRYSGVQAFLAGVRPASVGLILSAGTLLFLSVLCGVTELPAKATPDWKSFLILLLLIAVSHSYRAWLKKRPSPIALIAFSAALGIILYG